MFSFLTFCFDFNDVSKLIKCEIYCFSGEVRMPSGKVAKPDITDNKDGTVTVKYAPTEAGLHEMDIKYDGIHIPGNNG